MGVWGLEEKGNDYYDSLNQHGDNIKSVVHVDIEVPVEICNALADAVRATGVASINWDGKTSVEGVEVPYNPAHHKQELVDQVFNVWQNTDHYFNLKGVEAILGDEFDYYHDGEFELWIVRHNLSKIEFLQAINYPVDEEGLLKRYHHLVGGYHYNCHAYVVATDDKVEVNTDKIGYIKDGKLYIRNHHAQRIRICGNDGPYDAIVEYDKDSQPWCLMWWYPVKDTIDKKCFDSVLKEHHIDRMENVDVPDDGTLNRNTAAYHAAMVKKIEDAIKMNGYFHKRKFDSKDDEWWKTSGISEKYAVLDFHKVVLKDIDIIKAAKILGYTDNLSTAKGENGRTAVVSRKGIVLTENISKDVFWGLTHGNSDMFRGKLWQNISVVHKATPAEIMAQFKKFNNDPYEVTKLTTIWHYINFCRAIKEVLKVDSVHDTELQYIEWFWSKPANDYKRNFRKTMKIYGTTKANFISLMEEVKKVADKLGIPCRDATATYNAAEERAAARR